jgi:hypothetical protein
MSEEYIGRIYFDIQTLKAGKWRWAGGRPERCRSMTMPNSGWLPTAAEAAKQVEEYWGAMLRKRDEERAPTSSHVEEYKGYRLAIYSPNDHYAVITAPGSNAAMDFGIRWPRSTVVEGAEKCLERAKALIDELTVDVGNE